MSENDRDAISAALLLTLPENADAVADRIETLDGVEIVGRRAGRFALVLEAAHVGALGDLLNRLHLLPQVMSATMVAHYDASERDIPCTR